MPAAPEKRDPASAWQLVDGHGKPWLQKVCFFVQFADHTTVRSRDPRYRVEIDVRHHWTTVRLTDTLKQLDQTWIVAALDERCFTFQLRVTNTGDRPLALAKIGLLEGVFVEKHDPDRPHILLNGISTSAPQPTVLSPEADTLKSAETIALESPALAAGFLTGKHNLNHFTVVNPNGNPELSAHGDCDGCLLMPGSSRQTDTLYLSLHDNPLQQLERYAERAAETHGVKVWPPRVTWCTWYAGWIKEKMDTYRAGLEKGVEDSIPFVRDCFARRGGNHTMRICDDFMVYGDSLNRTHTIPGGFDRLAQRIGDAGLIPGVWYVPYWASTESEVFHTHPEWFAQNEDGAVFLIEGAGPQSRRAPAFAIFDTSRPDAHWPSRMTTSKRR